MVRGSGSRAVLIHTMSVRTGVLVFPPVSSLFQCLFGSFFIERMYFWRLLHVPPPNLKSYYFLSSITTCFSTGLEIMVCFWYT